MRKDILPGTSRQDDLAKQTTQDHARQGAASETCYRRYEGGDAHPFWMSVPTFSM